MMHDIFSSSFDYSNGIFMQRDFPLDGNFEKQYLSIREKENRIYSNEVLSHLPFIQKSHPLKKEWAIREESCKRLSHYLKSKKDVTHILEVGCGNGWLSNQLAKLSYDVCGLDVNEVELLQGANVFGSQPKLAFVFGDIFTARFPKPFFECIIIPASVQYFSDLPSLVNRLFELLKENGEIHIIDSPIYHPSEVASAKQRTSIYYSQMGFPEMADHYFHHTWNELESYKPELLHNPASIASKIKTISGISSSPFPWVKISKS